MAEHPGTSAESNPGQAESDEAIEPPQRPKYSPLVRRLAEEFDVDLATLIGTGPAGRITRHDVQQAAASGRTPDQDQQDTGSSPAATLQDTALQDTALQDTAPTDPQLGIGAAGEELASASSPAAAALDGGATFVMSSSAEGTQLARAHERLAATSGRAIALDALLVRIVASAIARYPELQLHSDPGAVGFIRATEHGMACDVMPRATEADLTTIDLAIANRVRSYQAGDEPIVAPVAVLDAGALGVSTVTAALEPGGIATLTFGRFEPAHRGRRSQLTITATFASSHIDLQRAAAFLNHVVLLVEDPILAFTTSG